MKIISLGLEVGLGFGEWRILWALFYAKKTLLHLVNHSLLSLCWDETVEISSSRIKGSFPTSFFDPGGLG
jgi:hypothetical protein